MQAVLCIYMCVCVCVLDCLQNSDKTGTLNMMCAVCFQTHSSSALVKETEQSGLFCNERLMLSVLEKVCE